MKYSLYKKSTHLLLIALVVMGKYMPLHALADGALTQVPGSPFPAGINTQVVGFSPFVGNLYLGVADNGSSSATIYDVNTSSGLLTQLSSSPVATDPQPFGFSYSPLVNGTLWAAIANETTNNISVYTVNTVTGSFTPVPGSPFASSGLIAHTISYSPLYNGSLYAAATNSGSNTVSVFLVDQATGAFTEIANSPFATQNNPFYFTYSPILNGKLYGAVTNEASNTLLVYSVDPNSGELIPLSGSPFTTSGSGPESVHISQVYNGKIFIAVPNSLSNDVSMYTIDSAGTFTEVPGSPFASLGKSPAAGYFSPVVYGVLYFAVANSVSTDISVFSVNGETGALTEIDGSPFAAGLTPFSIRYSPLIAGSLFLAASDETGNSVEMFKVTLPAISDLAKDIISKYCTANPNVT